jgi:hypothetical protein
MRETILSRIEIKRAELARLQEHDAEKISATRKVIVANEALLAEVKHLEGQIASAPAALKLLEDELANYAARRKKISHRLALALGSNQSIRLKSDELSSWHLASDLVAEIRTSVQQYLVSEPEKRLREIEATLNSQP